MKRIFSLSIVFVLTAFIGLAQGQMQELPNDPEVRKGKLENGLTYYIRHNEKPKGRAEFYLATDVGAIQETPDQDGLAHFLEHMCFNGTKNFPGKDLLNWLQSIGASFGGNVNASTGFEETQYMLNNIPLIRETVIDSCLLVLHDYAYFVTNDPAEIDKERGVIVEERRARRNAGWRMFEQSLPYYYGNSKYATCTLIGSQENLENFKPESLVTFYRTWYRPDLQAVVVVGDINVDQVEEKIKQIFADIPAAENPKPKEVFAVPPHAEPRIGVITDPEASVPSIEILWKSEAQPEEFNSTTIGLMTDLLKSIMSQVMAERFNDITSKADSPYLAGGFGIGNLCESTEATMANVTLKPENILGGFRSFYTEIEKMKRFGFTEAEVTRAKENILSSYERAANQADTRNNSEFVWPLIQNFFDKMPYMVPSEEFEVVKGILAQLNSAVVNQVIAGVMTGENASIVYTGPAKEGVATPTKEEILDVMQEVQSAQIEAPQEEETNVALLDPAALEGSKIKTIEHLNTNGVLRWKLKNGVTVFVLSTKHKIDQVLFNLYKPGGESLIATKDLASFDDNIFHTFQASQGVSEFSGPQLSKMLAGKNVSVAPYINTLYNGISGSSTVKDLETALQLTYLHYTQPRFDQEAFDNTIAQLKSILPTVLSQPNFIFQKEMNNVVYGGNPRRQFISEEMVEKASLEAIERNYRKLFADASGAVMVIVGDVDYQTLKPLVEKYIGSLPKGKKASKWQDNDTEIVKGNVSHSFRQDMETPIATVFQAYTSYKPYTVKDDVMLSAVNYVLDQIYTETLREDEGGTYGASVSSDGRKDPTGRYVLQVYFNSKPALLERLKNLAVEGLKKIAEEGPTDEQFTRTIENFKKNIPEKRILNSYWLDCIVSEHRDKINYDKEYEAAVNGMTKESIQAAAKALVESGNFIEVVMEPGKTTETE